MTNDYGNLELHTVLLDAMKDIDKICRENGLKYYLHAGTLLGAVNHGGFIPWDDDVDISMPPEDYDQMSAILLEKFPDKYRIQTYDNTPSHSSKLNKIQIIGAEVIYTDGTRDSVFIDLSVMHNAPDSKLARKIQELELVFWDRVLSVKFGKIIPTSMIAKLVLRPFSMLSKKVIGHRLDKIMARYDKKRTEYHALMIHLLKNPYTGVGGYFNDFVPREICENPQYIKFEDTTFMVYSDPQRDLIRRYGPDYWKPYPEEKRVSKHDIIAYAISDQLKERLYSSKEI